MFHKLGATVGDSRGKLSGNQSHSALMAASRPNHSVRRIVLGSGKILEEGLMDNSNPSKSIREFSVGTVRGWGIPLQFDSYRGFLVSFLLKFYSSARPKTREVI